MNQLADALSRMYSDEPKGIVRAASEYVTAEEEHTPSALILNMVSAPLYTGESIFLGAASAQREARRAFPNAQKVVLKVRDPSEQLEGESAPKISEIFENSPEHLEIPSEVEFEPKNIEHPTENVNDDSAEDLDNEVEPVSSLLANHGSSSQFLDDDTTAAELLSEDPISLTEVLDSGEPTLDIHNSIRGRYSEDSFFAKIVKDPITFRNFEVSNELVFLKDNERRVLCIPDVMIGARRLCEVLISHAHSILAHLGPQKTITYLRENVWWKGLNSN